MILPISKAQPSRVAHLPCIYNTYRGHTPLPEPQGIGDNGGGEGREGVPFLSQQALVCKWYDILNCISYQAAPGRLSWGPVVLWSSQGLVHSCTPATARPGP
jgi:hypothetical protein